MTAFIVVGTDERFASIVEGIEKRCLPRNLDVKTCVSVGCIIKSDARYLYRYSVYGSREESENTEGHALSELLRNQVASFRAAHLINGQIRVFVLRNPMNEDEYETNRIWMEELEELNKYDSNLFIFHVLFTYDLSHANNVCGQMPKEIIKKCVEDERKYRDPNNSRLIYFGNYTFVAAASSRDNDEHNFKLPRILADFMMLASSDISEYGIMQQIIDPDDGTGCFTLGYAECMYYYPDVERYYLAADLRDMLGYMLTCDDETSDVVKDDKDAMNPDTYPFGLKQRMSRLKIYDDVPFTEDISLYPDYADRIIDDRLKELKPLLEDERAHEIQEFENSDEITPIKGRIDELIKKKKDIARDQYDSEESYSSALGALDKELKENEELLKKRLDDFSPECPEFIDRCAIYLDYGEVKESEQLDCLLDGGVAQNKAQDYLGEAVNRYNALVYFAKSQKMRTFIGQKQASPVSNVSTLSEVGEAKRSNLDGCCPQWLVRLFRFGEVGTPQISSPTAPTGTGDAFSKIIEIARMLHLKQVFQNFRDKVDEVESEYETQKRYCEEYKLTSHLHNSSPLIDMDQLRCVQEKDSGKRCDQARARWRRQKPEDRNISSLKLCVESVGREEAGKFRWIEWHEPFPFVVPIDDDDLVDMCNRMSKMSSPFANFRPTTSTQSNNIRYVVYSDRKDIDKEISRIKGRLTEGQKLSASSSSHIESKICMFQFLPLNLTMLENLTGST